MAATRAEVWTRRFHLDVRRRDGGAPPRRWHQTVGRVALRRPEVLAVGVLGPAPPGRPGGGWRYEVVVWADRAPGAVQAVADALRAALLEAEVAWRPADGDGAGF
ncbi:MAG: hypothetical protein K6U87_06060 [Firmicutes bacterium]|nr:hypothetical protein [Bacillota bacterium]